MASLKDLLLDLVLLLLYINDLNQAIKFCKVYHFADDTNLLCLSNSMKKLNKLVNADLKHLGNWLNANKILLNVKKTEQVIFIPKQNKFEDDLKINVIKINYVVKDYFLLKMSSTWV